MRVFETCLSAGLAAALCLASASASAAPDDPGVGDPIQFSQSGTITLTYTGSTGGYDHLLELPSVLGTPIFVGSEGTDPVGSFGTPTVIGASWSFNNYVGGTELIFRLTNVESARLGDNPGTPVETQIFSGSGSLNPGGLPYVRVLVDEVDPNVLHVGFEDLFPERDSYNNLTFDVSLAPVPEPHEWAMMLSGLGLIGVIAQRRRKSPRGVT